MGVCVVAALESEIVEKLLREKELSCGSWLVWSMSTSRVCRICRAITMFRRRDGLGVDN